MNRLLQNINEILTRINEGESLDNVFRYTIEESHSNTLKIYLAINRETRGLIHIHFRVKDASIIKRRWWFFGKRNVTRYVTASFSVDSGKGSKDYEANSKDYPVLLDIWGGILSYLVESEGRELSDVITATTQLQPEDIDIVNTPNNLRRLEF